MHSCASVNPTVRGGGHHEMLMEFLFSGLVSQIIQLNYLKGHAVSLYSVLI